jgi:uncharacterized protein YndB with AHSA1/START domain
MAHPFEIKDEQTIEASPEQVWHALTNGRLIDSWYVGRTTVEPRQGGAVRTSDGLYRFIHGDGSVMVGHHLFSDPVDARHTEPAWQAWMAKTFSAVVERGRGLEPLLKPWKGLVLPLHQPRAQDKY